MVACQGPNCRGLEETRCGKVWDRRGCLGLAPKKCFVMFGARAIGPFLHFMAHSHT